MEIILCEDVPGLGKSGDIVNVKGGYARNYLLPKKKACIMTPANLKQIELRRKKEQEKWEAEKKRAEELAEKLSKVSCTVSVEVNDLGKLYGAVNESDIVKALELEGFEIDKKMIYTEKPIEELGIFDVFIKLHPEVTAKIRLWVTKK